MWEITSTGQLLNSLIGIIFGIISALFYYLFFPAFSLGNKKTVINIFDTVFFIVLAFFNLILLYCLTNGSLRFYIIFAQMLGFWFVKSFFSKIISKISSKVFMFIRGLINSSLYYLQVLVKKMLEISLKSLKIIKKLLKNTEQMLYTVFCKDKNEKK